MFDTKTLSFLTVNEAAVSLYGYTREEFSSMTINDIRPPSEVPAMMDKLSKIGAGVSHAGIWRHKKKDGTQIDVEITTHDLNLSGRSARLVLANDVTERIRAEERLHEQAELLDHAQEAILVRDLEGQILFWNKSAERIYGWSAEEVSGMNADDLLNQEPSSRLEEANRALSRTAKLKSFRARLPGPTINTSSNDGGCFARSIASSAGSSGRSSQAAPRLARTLRRSGGD